MAHLSQLVKLSHLLTYVITHVQLALRCDHLIVLLVFQRPQADRIIAENLAALCLVFLDVGQAYHGRAMRALDPERVDYLLDDA